MLRIFHSLLVRVMVVFFPILMLGFGGAFNPIALQILFISVYLSELNPLLIISVDIAVPEYVKIPHFSSKLSKKYKARFFLFNISTISTGIIQHFPFND